MRKMIVFFLLLATMIAPELALAWSENGHETVGAIADARLKGTKAGAQVSKILGTSGTGKPLTLQFAALWPDCARSVGTSSENFAFNEYDKYLDHDCAIFLNPQDEAALSDYARRNDTQCPYEGKPSQCHLSYHFADISVTNSVYKDGLIGDHPYDVVHAIEAAIAQLQHKPVPAPFSIKDDKEALYLLAHFVGDVHQPLHVGAIYLDANGKQVNPDKGKFDPKTDTHGGNSIKVKTEVLHHLWDSTTFATSGAPFDQMVADAAKVPASSGKFTSWPQAWASDTVANAQKAFQGLSFAAEKEGEWTATITDANYDKNKEALQRQQAVKGGARLAAILQAIWPN